MNKHALELSEAEEQEHLILDAIDKWLDRDVRPYVLEFDHEDKYPYDMVQQMKELEQKMPSIKLPYQQMLPSKQVLLVVGI